MSELPRQPLNSTSGFSETAGQRGRRVVDTQVERLTHYLDRVFRVPGTRFRFGLDPIIGLLLPGVGDALTNVFSAYIIWRSFRHGLPKIVVGRMVFNVAADYLLGSIPVLGDFIDFAFKANVMNLELLDAYASGERLPAWTDWLWLIILLGGLALLVLGTLVAGISLLAWAGFRLL